MLLVPTTEQSEVYLLRRGPILTSVVALACGWSADRIHVVDVGAFSDCEFAGRV